MLQTVVLTGASDNCKKSCYMAPASETAYDWGGIGGDSVINSVYPWRDLSQEQRSLRVGGPQSISSRESQFSITEHVIKILMWLRCSWH
jgi:hypothetical protein